MSAVSERNNSPLCFARSLEVASLRFVLPAEIGRELEDLGDIVGFREHMSEALS